MSPQPQRPPTVAELAARFAESARALEAMVIRLNLADQRLTGIEERHAHEYNHLSDLANELLDAVHDLQTFQKMAEEQHAEEEKARADAEVQRLKALKEHARLEAKRNRRIGRRISLLMQVGLAAFAVIMVNILQNLHGEEQRYVMGGMLAAFVVLVAVAVIYADKGEGNGSSGNGNGTP